MDERAGRAIALEKRLTITGTAKQRGLIPAAHPVFETLHQADFRIAAAVIRQILTRIGE